MSFTMLRLSFVAIALAVLSVGATPLVQVREPKVSLPFTLRLNTSGKRIPDIDRARAAQLLENVKTKSGPSRRTVSFDVTNEAVTYAANIGVGTPATTYSLLIDTGSSNTWVGAGKAFVETSSTELTGDEVAVEYGSGFFIGEEAIDTVTLAEGLTISGQSIGVALISEGFDGVDGILGLGPVDLTGGTVAGASTVPTISDNLFSQGTISQEVVGVFFAPTQSLDITNGELSFGGTDTSKITGDITFVPVTSSSPANEFWAIDQTITYGTTDRVIQSSIAGIVDTGTTLVLLATDAFNTYTSLTKATEDDTTGLLTITTANYANLQSLFFNIGGTSFEFTKNAQTWPRALNTAIGGSAESIFLIVSSLGASSEEGFSFVNGFTFLERFYSVFDTTNNQVGFATTAHTDDTTN
ncbi:hypothetical protein EW145_g4261 [Phellinidium pouzarii]|uniref:Peptidase A1 domain-containing protein n=1 Tax=Phellinidium pouzarii TaxID=167371 RepID=A0A4S4L4N7_9AGAM|nr:hypothetical protein EW145_g4261 [Phellinidium pouzarii]